MTKGEMVKKGLKEFQELYDLVAESTGLGLDLAQNLSFRYECAKDNTVQEEDVHMAYGLAGMGRKYPLDIMKAVHNLADSLGYTRKDYIENANRQQTKGNVNIYVAGQGSINCDITDLLKENQDEQ